MNVAAVAVPAAPVKAAWICLAIAWLCFLVPIPGAGLFVGWPMNMVAFILAIVCMSKAGAKAGLFPLLASIIVSPIVYFIGLAIFSLGFMKMAESSAKEDSNITGKWIDLPAIVSPQELATAYKMDKSLADKRFFGKKVELAGKIAKLESSKRQGLKITFDNAGGQAFWAKGLSAAAAKALVEGKWAILDCNGAGERAGVPVLNDCTSR